MDFKDQWLQNTGSLCLHVAVLFQEPSMYHDHLRIKTICMFKNNNTKMVLYFILIFFIILL